MNFEKIINTKFRKLVKAIGRGIPIFALLVIKIMQV